MKAKEKNEARHLRSEGESVRNIAKKLGVSKGTVSVWVRDINLTPEQQEALSAKNFRYDGQSKGGAGRRQLALEERERFQQMGREMVREQGKDFIAGCMLYWGEGYKHRNTCEISNCDPVMVKWFVNWLRTYFDVEDSTLRLRVNVYLNNGISLQDVEDFWLKTTGLPHSSLRNSIVNHYPTSSSGMKIGKQPHGTCRIILCDTSVVQRIFGAIKEYVGIDDNRWID